jgi:CRP/FNR family transcriptional regulator, cyclic AMP receptor protein
MKTLVHQAIDDFFAPFTHIRYKKGEIILRAGDPPSGVLYLKKGLVRMSCVAKSGDSLVVHVFKDGSYFPMMWVINDTVNTHYYEALNEVEIIRAPREALRRFLHDHPEILEHFMSRLLAGVSGLLQRMEYLVFESAYKKTILLLLYYIKNFSDTQVKGKLAIPLTHKEIAAWIGTTRETASLQIEELKKKHLIEYDKRTIIIPNIRMLEKEVDVPEHEIV